MSEDESINKVKGSIDIVAKVIKAAGDNPEAKEAAVNLGKSVVTVTKAINNILLPIAAVNFAFDKARKYFEERFQSDFEARTENIGSEDLIEPKASIAGPVLQGLAFAHEEPDLKNMYLSLLASAMNSEVADDVHPGFVEIIKQLNAEEAVLIKGVLLSNSPIALAQIHLYRKDDSGYITLIRHLLDLKDGDTNDAKENPRIPAMIDNWIRLGLVEVSYAKFLTGDEEYSWVEGRPEFVRHSDEHRKRGNSVKFRKGIMERTDLGRMFAFAVDLR